MIDPFSVLASLPKPENYTKKDQYRDFRHVFMQTEDGKRVLRRIMELGCVFHEPRLVSPVDPLMLAAFRGKRQLALEIFSLTNDEPSEPPKKQRK